MKVIAGSPSLVRSGASRLAQASQELSQTGTALAGAAGSVSAAWSGPAAVAFGGAAQRTEQACRRTADRLAEVSRAGTTYADRLQAAQVELARANDRERRLGEQELMLRVKAAAATTVQEVTAAATAVTGAATGVATGTPGGTGPSTSSAVATQRELADVAAERTRVAAAAEEIVRGHERDRAAFEAALTAAPPLTSIGEIAGISAADRTFLTEAKKKGKDAKSLISRTRATVDAFRSHAAIKEISRLPMPLDEATAGRLAAAEKSLAEASKTFTGRLPSAAGSPATIAERFSAVKSIGGRVNLVMTAWEGLGDLVKGDPEHPGFRDVSTRVAGAAGLVGSGLLLASAANPVGMALVTAYGAYKLGTWIYDHREDIKRVASQAWQRAAPVVEAGRQAVTEKAQEVSRAVSETGGAIANKAAEVRDGIGAGLRTLVRAPRFGW